MVSKTSYFNKTIFKKNFGRFWPLMIVYTLITLVQLPVALYFQCSNVSIATATNGPSGKELAALLEQNFIETVYRSFAAEAIMVAAILAAMAVFAYLYNSRSANMIHSLPVRREQLFITNYVSGLLFIIIPQLISFLASVVVMVLCNQNVLGTLCTWLLYSLGLCFFFYSFAVFCAMFTGNILALPVYYFILNFLFVIVRTMLNSLAQIIVYGMNDNIFNGFSWLSPGYYLTSMFSQSFYFRQDAYPLSPSTTLLLYCAAAVVFTVCSLLLYRKRHLETAGDMVSVSFVKPIFRIGVSFCGSFILSMLFIGVFGLYENSKYAFIPLIIALLLLGLVCFFVAEMLLCKAFAVFTKQRFLEYGAYAVVIVAFLLCVEGDVFGYETNIPQVEDVTSVDVYFDGGVSTMSSEHIDSFIQLHQLMVDDKKDLETQISKDYYATRGFSLHYTLKDGSTLGRSYQIPYTEKTISSDNSHFGKILSFMNQPELLMFHYFGPAPEDITILSGYVSVYDANDDTSESTTKNTPEGFKENASEGFTASPEQSKSEPIDIPFAASDAQLLYEAVKADIQAGTLGKSCSFDTSSADSLYLNYLTLEYTRSGVNMGGESINYTETASLQLTTQATNTLGVLASLQLIDETHTLKLYSDDPYSK